MAAWVFSGVLVGLLFCLLLSLVLAANCVNPTRRHNSLRQTRIGLNAVARKLCCGCACQLTVPEPLEEPPWEPPAGRRRPRIAPPGGPGLAPHLLPLVAAHSMPPDGALGIGSGLKGEDGESCVICQDDFGEGQAVAALPCHHAFHHSCITAWLLRRATCPMCQHEVTEAFLKGASEGPDTTAHDGTLETVQQPVSPAHIQLTVQPHPGISRTQSV